MEDIVRVRNEREKAHAVEVSHSLLERTGSWIRSNSNVSVLAAAAVVGAVSFLVANWTRGTSR